MGLLRFGKLFWSTNCIGLLTTPLVPYYDFVHRFPGRFWFVRLMTIRPYAVLRFPRLRHRAGFRLELCCDMARDAIRSPMIMLVFGDVRRFETFWCYAVCGASVGVATTFLSVCMISFALCIRIWFWYGFWHPDLYSTLLSDLLSVLIHISVLRALHTQYIFRTDPLSSGAAFHARRYRHWWSSTVGFTFCYFGVLLLIRSPLLVQSLFALSIFGIFDYFWFMKGNMN